jgi:hypothetical protein
MFAKYRKPVIATGSKEQVETGDNSNSKLNNYGG